METIGERIRKRRELLNLTYTDIANEVGVSRTTVMRYEKGRVDKMSVLLINPLSKVLKCSGAYLMCWTDDPTPKDD